MASTSYGVNDALAGFEAWRAPLMRFAACRFAKQNSSPTAVNVTARLTISA